MTPIVSTSTVSAQKVEVQIAKADTVEALIVALATKHNVNSNEALSIARCESHLRQFNENGEVLRGVQNPADIGVFQINEFYHLEKSKTLGYDIYTTRGNIEYAMWLMTKEGVRHWNYSRGCWGTA